jgi:hypothetical protein
MGEFKLCNVGRRDLNFAMKSSVCICIFTFVILCVYGKEMIMNVLIMQVFF